SPPGSRSAALTLAFARHRGIQTRVIPDERVAGFVALGMAQYSAMTVALVCTSGSAAYNLAPAVVEAYFQGVPLLIFTADRPKEWIHQQDGQTIYQTELYGKHVKKAFDLPADYAHEDARWYIERVLNEAINLSQTAPKGPVHVNVPIREPFYPTADEQITYDRGVKIIERLDSSPTLSTDTWHRLQNEFENAERVLIAVGQLPPNADLWTLLKTFSDEMDVPVLGDIIANVPPDDELIRSHDVFLKPKNQDLLADLRPDLLITLGDSFISKNFKLFLRKHQPARHWHIQPTPELIDTFQTLTTQIPVEPHYFFQKLLEDLDFQRFTQNDAEDDLRGEYRQRWLQADRQAKRQLTQFLSNESRWNEFGLVQQVLENLPENSVLHLANSMPVRYANLVGLTRAAEVFANRGTSGIDGCTSTAVGAATMTDKLVFLLTGDVAFFYDRNALWHPHLPHNLRVVLFNNGGGNIFRLIDGPSAQPELEQYFETRHELEQYFETRHHTTAERSAQDAGVAYAALREGDDFGEIWQNFIQKDNQSKLLEIFTDPLINGEVFQQYRTNL
ncbi:MAG: 2-succinyl-5-enolpyruvyl-6-hydroxy-3-cyclohexene-1-carboxylic-acid synthase, partial [Spirosomaceae bacterium]|nr:2-succinyl-5-enolpyruvyl-6-hydroxy-3-cyclohexene-1-carboxylic-acid synthase [Spirosomataceae bacterium]